MDVQADLSFCWLYNILQVLLSSGSDGSVGRLQLPCYMLRPARTSACKFKVLFDETVKNREPRNSGCQHLQAKDIFLCCPGEKMKTGKWNEQYVLGFL